MEHANALWQNSTWDTSWENICHHTTKSSSASLSAISFQIRFKCKLPLKDHHRRSGMDLWVWPKSKAVVFLFTTNVSHRVELLTTISTKVSYDMYGTLSGSNIKDNGSLVTDCCSCSHHPLWAMISSQKQHGCCPSPALSRHGSQWFFYVSENKI